MNYYNTMLERIKKQIKALNKQLDKAIEANK